MHWTHLEEVILRQLALSMTRTMTPDEQATTLLVIRLGLAGMLSGVVGLLLLIVGSKVDVNQLALAGAILFVVATALLGVAIVAAIFLDVAHDH